MWVLKYKKILLFIDQCVAHSKNTTFMRNIEVAFFPASCTSHLHPLSCIPSAITGSSSAVMIDGGQFQDASCAKLNMLFALHCLAEAWKLVTPTAIKNHFAKYGFTIEH